jgi:bla regulator protein blaR1
VEWLINWLWQGLALTAVAAIVLSRLRRLNAATRHRVWWVTLWLVLLLPLLAPQVRTLRVNDADTPSSLGASEPQKASEPLFVLDEAPDWAVRITLAIWVGWSLASGIRAGRSLLALRRFRRRCESVPADRQLRLPLWLAQRGTGRSARLQISRDVAIAGVLGFAPPIIALSPTALDALSDADLDRVVAHEHAHVQRLDDLGCVLLALIQAVFGLHPAVWWIARAIDLEREIACDDWVLALTGDGPRYARCLTRLASVSPASKWSLAPGVSLATRRLTARVTRLLDRGQRGGTQISAAAVAVWSPALLSMAVSLATVKLVAVQEAESLAAQATTVIEREVGAVETAAAPILASASRPKPAARRQHIVAPTGTPVVAPSGVARPPAPQSPESPAPAVDAAPLLTNLRTATSVMPLGAHASAVSGWRPDVSTPDAAETAGPRPPWAHAANAGVAISAGSKLAAVKAAGFFSRLGKSVAGSF